MDNRLSIVVLPSFYPMELDYPRGNFFEEQTRLIRARGVDCQVVFNENRSITSFRFHKIRTAHFQLEEQIENGLPVMRRKSWNIIPTKFQLGNNIWIASSVKLVQKYIARHGKPDLIHVHCVFNAGIVAQKIKALYQIPYIITEHSSVFALGNLSDTRILDALKAYKEASRVVVVSNSFRNLLLEKTGLDSAKVEVIPNFIDTAFFDPTPDVETRKGGNYIFAACFHEKNKKLDRLLKAFRIVIEKYPDWTLVIGGEGPETDHLKAMAESLGVSSKITFVGFLSKQEIKEYMAGAKLFVLPSDYETFGVVLIEAMAMGIPVVATDSGGPAEIITPNTGILVNKTEMDLAKGILEVINNLGNYDRKTIRQYVLDHYSGEGIADRYKTIYLHSMEQ